ncbi:ATP-binding cassette domain-containing protein [Streptomyces sp. NPDC088733]|uniref:ATP-binding cassette domain-containing protein n=1 Tax=Streptomyces sp. NPDC088733 TaxID=3365880 RepID=UPI0038249869
MITAEGFGLEGPRGWTFRDVTFTAPAGSLIAVEGASGTGRTCLLLALTGRMRAGEGHAEVAGHRLPRQLAAVRRVAALGPVDGVCELDPALTVGEHLRERQLLQRRFGESLRGWARPRAEREAEGRLRVAGALEAAGLDPAALPKAERTAARDLERLEALRLGTALALLGRPEVLAVDDVDHKLGPAERDEAWAMLRGIAAGGTTVLAVCTRAPEDALVVRPRPPVAATRTGSAAKDDIETGAGGNAGATSGKGAAHAHAEAGSA